MALGLAGVWGATHVQMIADTCSFEEKEGLLGKLASYHS